MVFQTVRCGKKITCDNLYVRSLTTTFEPQRANPRGWIGESRHAAPWMFRDRVARHYRLSDCIVLSIPSVLATDKDAGGLLVLQQASMPPRRLRSIPDGVRHSADWYNSSKHFCASRDTNELEAYAPQS